MILEQCAVGFVFAAALYFSATSITQILDGLVNKVERDITIVLIVACFCWGALFGHYAIN